MQRVPFAALLAGFVALILVDSAPALAKKGKAEAHPVANAYFIPDQNDPTLLHNAPGAVLDRGYLEMMAHPKIDPAILDESERKFGKRPGVTLHRANDGDELAPNPYAASVGNVLVLEGNSQFIDEDSNGVQSLNLQNGLFNVAETAIEQLGDNFDFITVFTTFESSTSTAAAFYLPLKNDIQGLGDCSPNTGETFGCQFDQTGGQVKVQGLVFMNTLNSWQVWDQQVDGTVHPFTDFDQAVFSVMGQEVAHRWGSALRFVDPRNGNVSKKLLGRDLSHWAAFVDTDASVMDGWDWSTPTDGRFDLLNDMDIYSTLDLYTMGALPVAAAKPFFFIDNAKYSEKDTGGSIGLNGRTIGPADVLELGVPSVKFMKQNGIDLGATGEKVDLTIQDIVNAEGNRCPDPDHTQRSFTQAIVLVTRIGQTAAQAQSDVDDLQTVTQTWETWWTQRTGHALTICTNLQGVCNQAVTSLGGGGVSVHGKADQQFIERGDTFDVDMIAAATADGAPVKNAHIVLSLDGGGAAHATLASADVPVGDIQPGKSVTKAVQVSVDDQYACGDSLIVVAQLEADNAATVREEFRLFHGYENIFVENFAAKSDDFKVNEDGEDGAKKGVLSRQDITLTCDMTPRTPESDNTPGSTGAYATDSKGELDGDSSLWSPEIKLDNTIDPELAFDFWFQGEDGDSLLTELSSDGKTFVKVDEETDSEHGWGLKRINIKDAFKGKIPASVTARWIFNGHGKLAGAVDDVKVIDPQGQCKDAVSFLGCGCSTDGSAPQGTAAALLGMVALRLVTRRKRV
ncbi:MAG TPA: MYXO-CTERM sorting domain-containing protein [Myxococcota bacterium]